MCKHCQSEDRMRQARWNQSGTWFSWAESMRAEREHVSTFAGLLWMNDLRESQWSGGNKAQHRRRSFSHPCTPPSMCLIFISTPNWVSPHFTFHFSNTDTPPPPHPSSALPRLSPAVPVSLHGRHMQIGRERPLEQNEALLYALHAHRRWLHTLRCDTESQMLCRTHYVTHTDLTGATECTSSEHTPGWRTCISKHKAACNMHFMVSVIK